MPTINTPILYQKDNLDGYSSNVCTDDKFFLWRNPLFRERTGHKQKNYWQFIKNYMHTNSNESGENIHKDTNTQRNDIIKT